MEKRFRFSTAQLAALKPTAKQADYHDTLVHGLTLRVSPGGIKSFTVLRWVKAEQRVERITLGRFPDLALAAARERAAAINAAIAEGRSPSREQNQLRAELTVDELFEMFMDRHARPRLREHAKLEQTYRNHIKGALGSHRASSVVMHDVAALHSRIGRKHKRQANKVLALISSMYNRARAWGLAVPNPVEGIERFREVQRDRFLLPNEAPDFFKAAALLEQPWRDYFMLSLLTGARGGNVKAARWEQFDLEAAEWRIPDTKNKSPVIVPLVPEAVKLLRTRRKRVNGDWVFPSYGKSGHIEDIRNGWTALRQAAKLKDFRPHDLRRTNGSYQAITGASLPIIGKGLGHKSIQATAIYARLHMDPVRKAMQLGTKALLKLGRKDAKNA